MPQGRRGNSDRVGNGRESFFFVASIKAPKAIRNEFSPFYQKKESLASQESLLARGGGGPTAKSRAGATRLVLLLLLLLLFIIFSFELRLFWELISGGRR